MIDLELPNDDVETIVVCSGGGSIGWFQWLVLLKIAERFKITKISGTSTGALSAVGFAKGEQVQRYVTEKYELAFKDNASPIATAGLAKIVDGHITFTFDSFKKYFLDGISLSALKFSDIFKAFTSKGRDKIFARIFEDVKPKLIKNFLSAPALLDNAPLYDRIREIQAINPGWECEAYWGRVNMRNGQMEECGWNDGREGEDEVDSIVASTTIPLVFPLVDGYLADAGLRDSIPMDQIFKTLIPGKKYRCIIIECSSDQMSQDASLKNPIDVGIQMVKIIMNESRRNDKRVIESKNEDARLFGEKTGQIEVPLYTLRYTGPKGALDFSSEAKQDFEKHADIVFNKFIQEYENSI